MHCRIDDDQNQHDDADVTEEEYASETGPKQKTRDSKLDRDHERVDDCLHDSAAHHGIAYGIADKEFLSPRQACIVSKSEHNACDDQPGDDDRDP